MNSPSARDGLEQRASVDWARAALPDAWPDRLRFQRLAHPLRIALSVKRGRAGRVVLPKGLPGSVDLPEYLLQEFHNLPNGNYSKSITNGFTRVIERVMLGTLRKARNEIAAELRGAQRALDIGAGAGNLSTALLQAGIPEVVALEPSPYLLQRAAQSHPRLVCVQGVIESSGLPTAFFDAAGACFVFHEIPPPQADSALDELRRLLVPGAKLVLVEPSPEQLTSSWRAIHRSHGWRGVYFRALALRVHEPFVKAWHKQDVKSWFEAHGFRLEQLRGEMPWQMFVAKRL